ncbi:aminotransferase class III-fold pyridoxal phosphate-dependent enzyme [Vibrio tritonius]|uniref:Aminotransferase class III-fold pyridoxal phosphate-dependent enzyme n=1 Tax=Vibrio tritonius TaxID=1435069 RepID=A0ABS7YNA8_9VIBR|nr:aminotransferase class III-fold pyridoxal phosphate-dependent enzyme [Vibrio tritonius]MCA2017171.1 aminotransferase class III-fold pyridoxal phosphate-dependent enzyme [Vibrio tritonius]
MDLSSIASSKEKDQQHVWHHMMQHANHTAPMFVKGEGSYLWNDQGEKFLDAVAGGVWCVNVGYGRTRIADAVRDQLVQLNYYAGSGATPIAAEFAAKLLSYMPGLSRVYYSNSGSEANEKAYKMVRQISEKKYGGKKHKILYRDRDYHGTTITCLSSCGQEERKNQYGPFTPGFVEIPHCCEYRSQYGETDSYAEQSVEAVEQIILKEGPETIGAMVLEPITAGGGVIVPPAGYFKGIEALCRKYDILLHIDEVVCGIGRTGQWFGYQHFGIQPDIVTMAKGLASAYAPISCTVVTEEVFNLLNDQPEERESYFRDISTFGGCTAGPAAALENLRIIEEEQLLQNSAAMGEYLKGRLQALQEKYPLIGDVRGEGLFIGMELVNDRTTKEPVDESVCMALVGLCAQQGVLIGRTNRSFRKYNNTLCLSPMLTLTKEEADIIADAIDYAFANLKR